MFFQFVLLDIDYDLSFSMIKNTVKSIN